MNRYLFNFKQLYVIFIATLMVSFTLAIDVRLSLAYTNEECIECHRTGSEEGGIYISIEEFKASVHAEEAGCQDCHTMVEDETHMETPGSGAVDCSSCHEQENRHGRGSNSGTRPQCYSCHTRHGMLGKDDPRSTVHASRLKETCRSCHPRESGQTDYISWLPSVQVASHSKQDFSQAYERTNCLGCHQGAGAHGEQEVINDQTCHTCHVTPDGENKLLGYIHSKAENRQPGVVAAASIYQVILGFLIIGGFAFFIRRFSGLK
ncbi:MAG: multiheme c-type cytochrome [Desulfobacterales bacterium]|nr:multiheme c-type cytochrome [Desulfobacterales bacterium]